MKSVLLEYDRCDNHVNDSVSMVSRVTDCDYDVYLTTLKEDLEACPFRQCNVVSTPDVMKSHVKEHFFFNKLKSLRAKAAAAGFKGKPHTLIKTIKYYHSAWGVQKCQFCQKDFSESTSEDITQHRHRCENNPNPPFACLRQGCSHRGHHLDSFDRHKRIHEREDIHLANPNNKCRYCNKGFDLKRVCVSHEKICQANKRRKDALFKCSICKKNYTTKRRYEGHPCFRK